MTTAKEIAERYICKLLGEESLERFTNEIIQYARETIRENRRIIKLKKVPAHVVAYLPVETGSNWPAPQTNAPIDIAHRYVDYKLGPRAQDNLELEILQYARMAVMEDRLAIKENNVLPHLVIYLPLPVLK